MCVMRARATIRCLIGAVHLQLHQSAIVVWHSRKAVNVGVSQEADIQILKRIGQSMRTWQAQTAATCAVACPSVRPQLIHMVRSMTFRRVALKVIHVGITTKA